MRAASKVHVEYEVLKYLMDKIDLTELEDKMLLQYKDDDYYESLEKRWRDGTGEVAKLVNNMIVRRLHRLPKSHPAYKEKVS